MSRIVEPRTQILDRLEHHGTTYMPEQPRARGRQFDYGACRSQRTPEHGDSRIVLDRGVERPNHVTVPARSLTHVLAYGSSSDSERFGVKQIAEYAH